MVRETQLGVDDFIYPLFVIPGKGVRKPIGSMPGQAQLSVDQAVGRGARRPSSSASPRVILFGVPDEQGRGRLARRGTTTAWCSRPRARSRRRCPELVVMLDACFDEYTTHGHCGVVVDGDVDNDATLENLARVALSAGAQPAPTSSRRRG